MSITSDKMDEYRREIERLKLDKEMDARTIERLKAIVDAARELMALKDLKDASGKTKLYLDNQPIRWMELRFNLNKLDKEST